MDVLHPVADLQLWARWLTAFAALIWLPGHVLIGRSIGHYDVVTRGVLAAGAGLLLAGLFAASKLPATPRVFLAYTFVAAAIGRAAFKGIDLSAPSNDPEPSARGGSVASIAAILASALVLGAGLWNHTVPVPVQDAANHAFLAWRIASTGSTDPAVIFGLPFEGPPRIYPAGWHAAAALLARVSGVPPFISTWFMPLVMLALLPVSLSALWTSWRTVPAPAVWLAALLPVANVYAPTGILAWGGFGVIVGFFLVPVVALAVRALTRNGSMRLSVVVGLMFVSLTEIHASEVPVALGLGAVGGLLANSRLAPGQIARSAMPGIVVFAVAAGPLLIQLSGVLGRDVDPAQVPHVSLVQGLDRFLRAGGQWGPLQALMVVSLVIGFARRSSRPIAALSVCLGLLSVTLGTFRDPVSRFLTVPFYQEPTRVLYLQLFVLPPLMAQALLWCRDQLIASRPHLGHRVLAVLLGLAVLPGVIGVVLHLQSLKDRALFTDDDARLAYDIAAVVGDQEWVANAGGDGSYWAMHLSGRRFVRPSLWVTMRAGGGPAGDAVDGLLRYPWPDVTRALATAGVAYVYATDRHAGAPRGFIPASYDRDPRFEGVLRGRSSGLYRILWEREPTR
jgi:hypothetical protein